MVERNAPWPWFRPVVYRSKASPTGWGVAFRNADGNVDMTLCATVEGPRPSDGHGPEAA